MKSWGYSSFSAWKPFFQNPVAKQQRKCLVQTTDWSPCSTSCGFGISTRVTSNNPLCKLVKESRLCQLRPCGQPDFTKLKVRLENGKFARIVSGVSGRCCWPKYNPASGKGSMRVSLEHPSLWVKNWRTTGLKKPKVKGSYPQTWGRSGIWVGGGGMEMVPIYILKCTFVILFYNAYPLQAKFSL